MGSITINGKQVKKWVIGGKTVKSLTVGGKLLSFKKIYWNVSWHYGGSNPHPTKNDWAGTFSTPAKQAEFEAITNSISFSQFKDENKIIGISLPNEVNIHTASFMNANALKVVNLPNATAIWINVFNNSPLTIIYAPKATTIKPGSLSHTINAATTEVWINHKFNTNTEKDGIFRFGNWSNITFHWTNDDGTPWIDPNPWHYGDGNYGPHPTKNDWAGTFSTPAKQAEFEAITNSISFSQFKYETSLNKISTPEVTTIEAAGFQRCQLTTLSLPKTTTIGGGAFQSSHLTSLTAPVVTDVGAGAFHGSHLTSLDLPEVLSIGVQAFYQSPLTHVDVRKATTIGDKAFSNVINGYSTYVYINKKFDSDAEKDRIFGSGHWSNITFKWLNDDGTPA